MQIRRVYIENFRGIKRCEWVLSSRLLVLIGPGGSTKTTLLDAIGLALSRSYRPQFSDADFYRADTREPILIEVAVGELPLALAEERTFGFDRSGIDPSGKLHHDPSDGTEPCLLVRLTVDATLEPSWRVVRPGGEDDGQPISARQRQRLGFFRIGDAVDQHLRWGTASALSSMTEARTDAASVIVDAQRSARSAVFDAIPSTLQDVAAAVQVQSRALGAAPYESLRPGLDPAQSGSTHSLVLHDENVPLTSEGLGTRRLTGLSIQERAVEGGSIIAVDEIEYGLEPHRLVHVLQYLRDRATPGQLQVILTTHSPSPWRPCALRISLWSRQRQVRPE
jgi:putative ATP-dependent endonuclease of the OLD family